MIMLKQINSARKFLPHQALWAVICAEKMNISAHRHPLDLDTWHNPALGKLTVRGYRQVDRHWELLPPSLALYWR